MKRTLAGLLLLAASCADPRGAELDFTVQNAASVPDAPAPNPGRVTFGRDGSERVFGVRIRDARHVKPKVVYSVRLPDVRAAETLKVRGEVALSRCNPKDIAGESGDAAHTPCDSRDMKKNPYGYAPRFGAAFVLADSPTDAGGRRLGPWIDTVCTQGRHHCALALPQVTADGLPNAAEKWVNLVVTADANGANAREWHVMEVEQRKGALAVTRLGAGAGGPVRDERTQQLLSNGPMTVDRPKEDGDPTQVRRLLYQVKLDGLKGGDVIDADAKMRARLVGGYTCDPLLTGQLVLTRDRQDREPKGPWDEVLGAKNGSNCPDHGTGGCRYQKSGAVRIRNGTPGTMYLSYIAMAVRSCADPAGRDKWEAAPNDGFLEARVRR